MAIRTAVIASAVVRPAISIIRRTRATSAACSAACSGKSVLVMQGSSAHTQRLKVIVEGSEGSARLDRVLAQRLPDLSRSRLKALIQGGQVLIEKVLIDKVAIEAVPIRDPAYHVAKGDTIIID